MYVKFQKIWKYSDWKFKAQCWRKNSVSYPEHKGAADLEL